MICSMSSAALKFMPDTGSKTVQDELREAVRKNMVAVRPTRQDIAEVEQLIDKVALEICTPISRRTEKNK